MYLKNYQKATYIHVIDFRLTKMGLLVSNTNSWAIKLDLLGAASLSLSLV